MAQNQRARAASESIGFLVILAGILVAANILVQFFPVRLDCTANDLFSLSDGSRKLAGSLTDELEVKAYFTEDLPPPFHDTRRYVADILAEYQAAADNKIRVTFINPDTDTEREEARDAGILEVEHAALSDDGTNVVRGYRGLVLRYLDKKEVIPVVQDTAGLEYAITTKLKGMTGERTTVGVVGGHEGPSPSEGLAKLKRCLPTYELEEVQANGEIDAGLDALLVVGPQSALSEGELRNIDAYLMKGGAVGVFGGSMKVELQSQEPQASSVDTGLNKLLRSYGVALKEGIVHDARAETVPMRTQIGNLPVPYPPWPRMRVAEEEQAHAVLFRLRSVSVPFSAPLETTEAAEKNKELKVTTLLSSSEDSWNVTAATISLTPRDPRQWPRQGDVGPFPLAIAVEGKLPSAFGSSGDGESESSTKTAEKSARVLVVGGSFLLRDELMPEPGPDGECPLRSHNAFAYNAIDWLAQESDLVAIRAKTVEEPSIDVPEDVSAAEEEAQEAATEAAGAFREGDESGLQEAVSKRDKAVEQLKSAQERWETKKDLYRWGNMFGVPLLLALFGFVRWKTRQGRRQHIKL